MADTATAPGFVWIFHGERANFASAVFTTLETAEMWIRTHKLVGTLTKYPVDVPVYDWAIAEGLFMPKRDDQRSSRFIGGFTTAGQEHYHYNQDDYESESS